jgi:multiple sugar transport system permease protein
MKHRTQKGVIITAFVLPAMILLLLFNLYPAVRLFELSFTNWDGLALDYDYIGLRNYVEMFEGDALETLVNNTAYLFMGLIQIVAALLLAVVLNTKLRGRNFFRTVIFMPRILNVVAIAFMFKYLFDFEQGPINEFLRAVGMGHLAIRFFPNSYAINITLATISFWQWTGFYMILFLAGLQSIPNELYEIASLDGASFRQKIFHIALPNLATTVQLQFLLVINGAVKTFQMPLIVTNGGPVNRSSTFVFETIETAFEYSDFGLAAAMGVFATFMILLLVWIQRRFLREGEV